MKIMCLHSSLQRLLIEEFGVTLKGQMDQTLNTLCFENTARRIAGNPPC
jgi:hypothetical protein